MCVSCLIPVHKYSISNSLKLQIWISVKPPCKTSHRVHLHVGRTVIDQQDSKMPKVTGSALNAPSLVDMKLSPTLYRTTKDCALVAGQGVSIAAHQGSRYPFFASKSIAREFAYLFSQCSCEPLSLTPLTTGAFTSARQQRLRLLFIVVFKASRLFEEKLD